MLSQFKISQTARSMLLALDVSAKLQNGHSIITLHLNNYFQLELNEKIYKEEGRLYYITVTKRGDSTKTKFFKSKDNGMTRKEAIVFIKTAIRFAELHSTTDELFEMVYSN